MRMESQNVRAVAVMSAFAFALTQVSEGAERYRPSDPHHVVLELPEGSVDDFPERLSRSPSQDPGLAARVANGYLERARTSRDPRYFGRAEALIAPWLKRPEVSAELLRIEADILQNRHDFSGALLLLDKAVNVDPRHLRSRLLRATVLMVRGGYTQARSDCRALISGGEMALGSLCLAQAFGGGGDIQRAERLINATLAQPATPGFGVRAWALMLRADIEDRRGDRTRAERYLREALLAAPSNEAARIGLAELLLVRGAPVEALAAVDLPRPSVAFLVQRARAQAQLHDPALQGTLRWVDALLTLEVQRKERVHLREAALLALDIQHDAKKALDLAKANFATQRETLDVRLLARSALAANDDAALRELRLWRATTRFQDEFLDTTLATVQR